MLIDSITMLALTRHASPGSVWIAGQKSGDSKAPPAGMGLLEVESLQLSPDSTILALMEGEYFNYSR